MKKNKRYWIFALFIVIAVILLFNKLLIWGIALFTAGLIVLGIQELIALNVKVTQFQNNIKNLDQKNNLLQNQNAKLLEENSFLKDRHFQVTQIKSILELNLFEIDTRFTRSVNREEKYRNRDIKYFGSLNVSLIAKYGIDCKELRFKYIPESDMLLVANISPKFLSFGNRKLEWGFFEILEYRSQNPLAGKKWMASDDLYEYANTLKEKYRTETENSLEKGPEEFAWIHSPIRQNVESIIKILFEGLCVKVKIVDRPDNSFVTLDNISFKTIPQQKVLNGKRDD
ncbi:MAG: hypothetical protein JXN62_04990 [Bacteroidales bacterium]|nr:hypothetical protein [Bacteroidales bacterium]